MTCKNAKNDKYHSQHASWIAFSRPIRLFKELVIDLCVRLCCLNYCSCQLLEKSDSVELSAIFGMDRPSNAWWMSLQAIDAVKQHCLRRETPATDCTIIWKTIWNATRTFHAYCICCVDLLQSYFACMYSYKIKNIMCYCAKNSTNRSNCRGSSSGSSTWVTAAAAAADTTGMISSCQRQQ